MWKCCLQKCHLFCCVPTKLAVISTWASGYHWHPPLSRLVPASHSTDRIQVAYFHHKPNTVPYCWGKLLERLSDARNNIQRCAMQHRTLHIDGHIYLTEKIAVLQYDDDIKGTTNSCNSFSELDYEIKTTSNYDWLPIGPLATCFCEIWNKTCNV